MVMGVENGAAEMRVDVESRSTVCEKKSNWSIGGTFKSISGNRCGDVEN